MTTPRNASGVKPKGVHSLIKTAELCRGLGAKLTPATSLGAPAPYEAAVMQVAQADKRGVALRVTLREFSSAQNWVPSWPHSLKETDLIVDLGDKVTTIADLGSTLNVAFHGLHKAKDWRSVTVAGTSMPENFGGMKPGLQTIERAELALCEYIPSGHVEQTLIEYIYSQGRRFTWLRNHRRLGSFRSGSLTKIAA